jgi:acyl-CoA synthetase (NDP forming)
MGFPGAVYGVNPRYASLYDRPSYPSLSSLPQTPDCVLLAVPNARLVEALREAAECGVKAAVIFANAHGIQDELTAIAQEHEMAICGPNCMGFINFNLRLPVSGYPVLNAPAGHISLISHSGSVWESLVQNNRQVHYNIVISSGNEMVTTLADYLLYLLDEPATRVVGLFMEAVRDPAKFKVALATAVARNIPIVALKVGRSERGAKLAQAHSGALAGTDAAYEALFDYYGVRRVQSPDEMMDTLELLSTGFRPPTRFVSAVLDSGGERALLVDLAETTGVEFAPLSESTKAAIATVIEPGLAPENPLDAWGTGNSSDESYQT